MLLYVLKLCTEESGPILQDLVREMIGYPFEGPGVLQKGTKVGFVRSGEGTKKLLGATWKVGEEGLEAAHTMLPLSTALSLPELSELQRQQQEPWSQAPSCSAPVTVWPSQGHQPIGLTWVLPSYEQSQAAKASSFRACASRKESQECSLPCTLQGGPQSSVIIGADRICLF